MKRIGYLGQCNTYSCGGIAGYFCVKCRHYVSHCACGDNTGGCVCEDDHWWAGKGERKHLEMRLEATEGRMP